MRTKIRLFQSNVKSVLLYGSETWSLTKTLTSKLLVFINTCLRRIMKIKWSDKIHNNILWERTGQEPIDKEIGRRKWRWIDHTLRKPTRSITRHALQWNPQGKRGRGRPQITWRRQVEEDMKRGDISWREAARNAQDRDKWKSVVCGLYPEKG